MSEAALAGLKVAVTGASGDIGRALCRSLAAEKAHLSLLGRDAGRLERLANELRHLTSGVSVRPVDLTSDESIARAAAQLQQETGQVDILVHGAGIFEMGAHASAAIIAFDRHYRTNVRGPYLLTQALLPLLCASRGQVVFINSTVGLEARAEVGQYAATQHALRAMADALRAEVNAEGVRVLSIYLGRTATARQAQIFRLEGRNYKPELLLQPQDVADMIIATLRLPRTAEVTEIRMRPLVKSY